MAACSCVLTWILARAVDVVVGVADKESYAAEIQRLPREHREG
ncbi:MULTISPECIES: hypothetical protein [Streptomyces]|nr:MULTISPECIES: hypothetical protein [Streptomyces]